MFKDRQRRYEIWVPAFILSILIFVFATHPFLKLPFDPWEHLIKIRSIFDEGKCFLYWPGNKSSFCSWHFAWAKVFSVLRISDTFIWASIIHYVQFLFCLACLFYFSWSVYRQINTKISKDHILCMSCFSVLYWLVGNGTYSVEYQQAWIMWYSVTYQGFTIPLFWLITGLSFRIFFDANLTRFEQRSIVFIMVAGFLIIAFFHPTEAVYFFIFLCLGLMFTPLISVKSKMVIPQMSEKK